MPSLVCIETAIPPGRKTKMQYLEKSNRYQNALINLGNAGLTYIVECTAESQEPGYEGFATEAEAMNRATALQSETGYTHGVFRIQQDGDGDWTTDYKHL